MTEIIYGEAELNDVEGIQETARASWYETYKHIFSGEFVADFLARAYSTENLRKSVENPQSIFLVARFNGDVIGFCQFGPSPSGSVLNLPELYRLYVHPDWWRQGIGRRLLELAEARLIARGDRAFYCYVHKANEIGKAFYLKRGFVHEVGSDKDDEWCMVRRL